MFTLVQIPLCRNYAKIDLIHFSIGVYDLPASIDYILAKTGQTKLHYIGHSQGATAFFVMTSEKPEYNDKIEMAHALAPGVFVSYTGSSLLRTVLPFLHVLQVNDSKIKETISICISFV